MGAVLCAEHSGHAISGRCDPREEFRQMVHEALDEWVDELMFLFDEDKHPNLMEISDVMTATRQKFLGAFVERLIESKYGHLLEAQDCACPRCRKMCKKRIDSRKELVTMQGASTIMRP